VAADAVARSGSFAGVVVVIAAIGAVILMLVLWRGFLDLLPWGLATGGSAYVATLFFDGHRTDGAAPLVGAALLLSGELAAWSLDARWRVTAEAAVLRRRALALAALLGASIAGSGGVIALSGVGAGSGLVLTTLGAAAAVGAVGVGVALLVRGR